MSVQICEGAWRNRRGQRVLVTHCQSVGGQRWTDGAYHFGDDGSSVAGRESPEDLVRFIAPLVTVVQTESSQRAPVSRPAETENTTAVAGGASEDPGRIIYDLEERLKTANATAMDHHCEGMKAAYLAVIKTFVEASR